MTSSSIVQLAFDSNDGPSHCGYCKSYGSYSVGLNSPKMLVEDYQILLERGWRKCGTYYYKALMDKTCCPLYTIRCDTNNFRISRSQRRVIENLNLFINENIKPGEKKSSVYTNDPLGDLDQWMKTESSTRAMQLIQHILTNDEPPSDAFLKQLRARQKRWYKKLLKLKSQNKLTLETDIRLLIKRYKPQIKTKTLEELLKFNENSKNKFQFRLIRSYPRSEEFQQTLKESHSIYQRYQMAIHGDSFWACSLGQFEGFLCKSSLENESQIQNPSCGYGSFHLQYYLNDKIIACSVIDILPGGVSSVYFYYDPDFAFLKLGVYSALKEIELTRQLSSEVPNIKYYYLGFYVHSCTKMRYKGQYQPAYLLCPETYTWHSIEKCLPLLNTNKYARFETDPNKTDENEETNIEHVKLRLFDRIITPLELQEFDEDFFLEFFNSLLIFVKFVGRICANRIIISVN